MRADGGVGRGGQGFDRPLRKGDRFSLVGGRINMEPPLRSMGMTNMNATVVAVNISGNKGRKKVPVDSVVLKENHGIVGDAHAGDWRRQVSLLAIESIEKMRLRGLTLGSGDFAENITTRGIGLPTLPLGAKVGMGDAVIEVTQIGKECHERCAIYEMAGDCIMPREGIFAMVIRGGTVRPGDEIVLL